MKSKDQAYQTMMRFIASPDTETESAMREAVNKYLADTGANKGTYSVIVANRKKSVSDLYFNCFGPKPWRDYPYHNGLVTEAMLKNIACQDAPFDAEFQRKMDGLEQIEEFLDREDFADYECWITRNFDHTEHISA